MLKVLLTCFFATLFSTASAWQKWWSMDTGNVGYDEIFKKNLKSQNANGSEKKKLLMDFLKLETSTSNILEEHNKKTDFAVKKKGKKAIIPYLTHTIYVTKKTERSVMNHPNVWETVDKLAQDINEGVEWKHIFWTNDRLSVVINATACEGRCEVRLFN